MQGVSFYPKLAPKSKEMDTDFESIDTPRKVLKRRSLVNVKLTVCFEGLRTGGYYDRIVYRYLLFRYLRSRLYIQEYFPWSNDTERTLRVLRNYAFRQKQKTQNNA